MRLMVCGHPSALSYAFSFSEIWGYLKPFTTYASSGLLPWLLPSVSEPSFMKDVSLPFYYPRFYFWWKIRAIHKISYWFWRFFLKLSPESDYIFKYPLKRFFFCKDYSGSRNYSLVVIHSFECKICETLKGAFVIIFMYSWKIFNLALVKA